MSPPTSTSTSSTTPTTQPTGTYRISSSRSTDEKAVKSWGFTHVFTWSDGPNAHYPPHSHAGLTTHLVRRGEMTVCYPEEDPQGRMKETFGVGARVDVGRGVVHEVWMGREGCEYVIGE